MNGIINKSEITLLTEQIARLADQLELLNRKVFRHEVSIKTRKRERVAAYHPITEKFWEIYHRINAENGDGEILNHSSDGLTIAVNLTLFMEKSAEYSQERLDMYLLKQSLPASRRYPFIANNRSVWSRHLQKTIKCWIFQKEVIQ